MSIDDTTMGIITKEVIIEIYKNEIQELLLAQEKTTKFLESIDWKNLQIQKSELYMMILKNITISNIAEITALLSTGGYLDSLQEFAAANGLETHQRIC